MRDEQQAYLSMSSAAALLSGELSGAEFHDEYDVYDASGVTLVDTPISVPSATVPHPFETDAIQAQESIREILTGLVNGVYNRAVGDTTIPPPSVFTIEPEDGLGLAAVKVELKIEEDYDLLATLSMENPVSGASPYEMVIAIQAEFKKESFSAFFEAFYYENVLDPDTGNSIPTPVPAQVPYTRTTVDLKYLEGQIGKED
jgi:hypothetical protein